MAFRKFCDNCGTEITGQHVSLKLTLTEQKESEYKSPERWVPPNGSYYVSDREVTHCCEGCAKGVVAALHGARLGNGSASFDFGG